MDETVLRHSAMQTAATRLPQDASVDALLAEAGKVYDWLTGKSGLSNNTQHESVGAVAGQEPRAEG